MLGYLARCGNFLRKKQVRTPALIVIALGITFFVGGMTSIFEFRGSSWPHVIRYKTIEILGLAKFAGLEGGVNFSSARYEFVTIFKANTPGVFQLTTTDTKNILGIERSSGQLLLLTPDGKSYTEKIISPSVFPKDADGKPIFNAAKTLVNSKPPIVMGVLYTDKKLLYSLAVQEKVNKKECQALVLYEVPLPSLDTAPTGLIERFRTPCIADLQNGVMWAGRIVRNNEKIFLSIGEQRYDRSQYPKTDMVSAADLVVTKTVFGKILAFDPVTYKYEIYSTGHRNAQGLFWDNDNKRLLSSEHGPNGGDELNVITKGGHYGWPTVTYGKPYPTMFPSGEPEVNDSKNPGTGVDVSPTRKGIFSGTHDGFLPPLMSWSPGTGMGNLFHVALNSPLKDWRNDIIVAMMGESRLHRLRLHKGAVVFDENININARVRDLFLLSTGDIALGLDKGALVIIRVADDV
ncbi:MAG: hypothetical protein A2848_02685 [Candidatus Magasanikbacteria bacterium RIFCSPHIGHO2_01_FULL_50_8]|nr:MAG: hypothetical protein A2848_02685 [Candidatus Magasanikbacteria bacterium RIFCSPHIGHO2_01_FULL_50_8]